FAGAGLLAAEETNSATTKAVQKVSTTPLTRPAERIMPIKHRLPTCDYRVFEQFVRIAAPLRLHPAVESLMGGLRIDFRRGLNGDAAFSPFHLEIVPGPSAWRITLGGDEVVAHCDTDAVLSEIERLVIQAVIPATPHLLTLHAAAVQSECGAVLLVGGSGAGKTTLSIALARAGWKFGCDEIVLLGRELNLRPLPFPACIKSDSFRLVETWFPAFCGTREHKRYGETVKYVPMKSHSLAAGPGLVVFPHYKPASGNKLLPLDRFSGLQRILEHCVYVPPEFHHTDVPQLLQWHHAQRYFELFFNDCGAAVTLLSGACGVAGFGLIEGG